MQAFTRLTGLTVLLLLAASTWGPKPASTVKPDCDDPEGDGATAESADRFLRPSQHALRQASHGISHTKVLIVAPNSAETTLLRDGLLLSGLDAETVTRADESAAVAVRFRPDLVIVDLDFPHGRSVGIPIELHEVRLSNTPMIAISRVPAILRVARVYDLFRAHVEKPVNIDELVVEIELLTRS